MVDYERRHHGPKSGRKRRYRGQYGIFSYGLKRIYDIYQNTVSLDP